MKTDVESIGEGMNHWRTRIGVGLTVLYVGLIGWYSWLKWDCLLHIEPSNLGDFLAGVFGPPAFMWLILGYFQQGDELKNSTAALQQQAKQLRDSVAQQAAMVAAAVRQLELEVEARARIEGHEREQLRPRYLVCPEMGSSLAQGLVDLTVKIKNEGHKAANVVVHFMGEDRLTRQVWNSGETRSFKMSVRRSHIGRKQLSITSTDGAGEMGVWTIPLEIRTKGDFLLEAECGNGTYCVLPSDGSAVTSG